VSSLVKKVSSFFCEHFQKKKKNKVSSFFSRAAIINKQLIQDERF
jgi:hypothetical protein